MLRIPSVLILHPPAQIYVWNFNKKSNFRSRHSDTNHKENSVKKSIKSVLAVALLGLVGAVQAQD
ncbi:MAG: hypothetical protein ACK5Q1_09535, partial [Limnobacter sp.]